MAAYAKIEGLVCQVKDGVWSSPDAELTELLNIREPMVRRDYNEPRGPSDPNPDETSARLMAFEMNGELLSADPGPNRDLPGDAVI
jgi:hypothetical protein